MGFSTLQNQYDLKGQYLEAFFRIRGYVEKNPFVRKLLGMGWEVRMSSPMQKSTGEWWVTVYYGRPGDWSSNSFTVHIPTTITQPDEEDEDS